MKKAGFSIFSLLPFWMSFGSVVLCERNHVKLWTGKYPSYYHKSQSRFSKAAIDEPKICYILDAILFIYGVVLTVLYCRMKLMNESKNNTSYRKKDAAAEGVYEGLAPHAEDTYETIQMNKAKA